eukprot:8214891-Pyramimonas_sp.AAC.1
MSQRHNRSVAVLEQLAALPLLQHIPLPASESGIGCRLTSTATLELLPMAMEPLTFVVARNGLRLVMMEAAALSLGDLVTIGELCGCITGLD